MARAGYLDSLSADNAHLPTVSVFIVLLAMMAALTTYARPSSGNFEAAKLSLIENFAAKQTAQQREHRSLSLEIVADVEALCSAFTVPCMPVSAAHMDGLAVMFPADAFDAAVAGLTINENKFLKELVAVAAANKGVRITLLPPSAQQLAGANITILMDLMKRFSGGDANLAALAAPSLQSQTRFGFLIEPVASKS